MWVAVITNEEEEKVGLPKAVPYLLEAVFKDMNAQVGSAEAFSENAVRDGRLVPGQNPASAAKAAKLFAEALEESDQ